MRVLVACSILLTIATLSPVLAETCSLAVVTASNKVSDTRTEMKNALQRAQDAFEPERLWLPTPAGCYADLQNSSSAACGRVRAEA